MKLQVGLKLTTTELTSDLSAKNASRSLGERYPKSQGELIRAYIDWQIDVEAFAYVLVARKADHRAPWRATGLSLPSICASRDVLITHKNAFVMLGNKGFEILFSSHASTDDHVSFFAKFDLKTKDQRTTDARESPLLSAAWNKADLGAALDAAMRLGGGVYCAFGHDADPVYLLESSSQ